VGERCDLHHTFFKLCGSTFDSRILVPLPTPRRVCRERFYRSFRRPPMRHFLLGLSLVVVLPLSASAAAPAPSKIPMVAVMPFTGYDGAGQMRRRSGANETKTATIPESTTRGRHCTHQTASPSYWQQTPYYVLPKRSLLLASSLGRSFLRMPRKVPKNQRPLLG